MKETVADAFISRFQLKPDELQALKGTRNGPISEVKKLMLKLKCLLSHAFLLRQKWRCVVRRQQQHFYLYQKKNKIKVIHKI